MLFIYIDASNLSDMNHNLLVLIESKEYTQLKLKQLEDITPFLESELATVKQRARKEGLKWVFQKANQFTCKDGVCPCYPID
jgi:hypothetical protein